MMLCMPLLPLGDPLGIVAGIQLSCQSARRQVTYQAKHNCIIISSILHVLSSCDLELRYVSRFEIAQTEHRLACFRVKESKRVK
jgi:hypothetical protein